MKYDYPTAGPWMPHELGKLRDRVAMGGRRKEICFDVSKQTGRSPKAVHTKMYVEGLVADNDKNPIRKIVSDGQSRDGSAPLDLGAGDLRYVSKLMGLGGFASFVRLNDGRVIFGHAGKAWVQP